MPDTLSYFIAGYIVIFVLIFGYVLHLFRLKRKINRQRDELSMEDN
jgi:CcmD family protein